ncbi:MAG: hypothetical protein ABW321_17725, partial [Polyangiales bacterium]
MPLTLTRPRLICGWLRLRCSGLRAALLQRLVEQQIRCTLDDQCQITVGHLMMQEFFELRELVMHRLARRKRHLVSPRAQRRNRGRQTRR